MLRTTALLAALVTVSVSLLPTAAFGQGAPFSKLRMSRLRWNPGDQLQVGSVDSGDRRIALTFTRDASVGAVLTEIGHRGTRADGTVTRFAYAATPPLGQPRGLWKVVTRPLTSQTPTEVLPDSALNFETWVDSRSAPTHAIFSWMGCAIPCQSPASVLLVELEVKIPATSPNRAEWNSRVIRLQIPGGTEQHTVDEVHAPIVYARQPGSAAQARILIPLSTNFVLPATNLPMSLWRLFGLSADVEHPARGQQMQFSALYGGDPTSIPLGNELFTAFRKILYFSTEDHEGYYKRFQHDCVPDPLGLEYYRWAPVYFPEYGPSPWLNYFQSGYPAVLCALEAADDTFWYDVTSHYREFVRSEMGLVGVADPAYALNPDYPRSSVMVATSVFNKVNADLPAMFQTFTDTALDFQQVFREPDGSATPVFMEWQKWLKGDGVEDPIGPGYNPRPFTAAAGAFQEPTTEARNEIARAHAAGINMSMYTLPLYVNDADWPSFDPDWFVYLRDGTQPPPLPTGGMIVDFGHTVAVPGWMGTELYDDIMNTTPQLGGVFLDTLGGQGSFLRYPSPNGPLPFNFRHHGGTAFVEGGNRAFDVIRARVGRDKTGAQHPEIPFVLTEAAQEFYAGHYDFGQHGIKPVPLQTQQMTVLDLIAGNPFPTPVETANPNPPLWNPVYHEYSRADAIGVMLHTTGVRADLGGGQPPGLGLTWQQWADYTRMVTALRLVQGMKPQVYPFFYDYKDFTLFVNRNGVVEARDPSVPQQNDVIAFLQRVHAATSCTDEAGQYLCGGIAERPLRLPPRGPLGYPPLVVTSVPNPSTAVATLTSPATPGVLHFNEDSLTIQQYPVATVMHGVWRTPGEDRVGIVFVNWSDFPSAWTGSFDPAHYDGIDQDFVVKGLRPAGAGVVEYLVGQGNGDSTFGWGLGTTDIKLQHHDAAAPGFMPPRSVQVFVVE